jgi:hypothetical protein
MIHFRQRCYDGWSFGTLVRSIVSCLHSGRQVTYSGANSPHTHPRATEVQIVVRGGPIFTEFIMENGVRPVKNNVSLGMATIFP